MERDIYSVQEKDLPESVLKSLGELAISAKEGLLALSIAVGLEFFKQIMEDEVTEIVGPKGKHNPNRKANRHGYEEEASVVLGGQRVPVRRPRVRTVNGQELILKTYKFFQNDDILSRTALERMLLGVSTRNYTGVSEELGSAIEATSISKSTISRRFIEETQKALEELMTRPLDELDICVLMIDAVNIKEHVIVASIGIDIDGNKHVLGLWEGSTENTTVCQALLSDLVSRGLSAERGLLAVIDGSKALKRALINVFGDKVLIQRCQVHKRRNIIDHLPENKHDWVKMKLREAWSHTDPEVSKKILNDLANQLETAHPGAAASIREGLEETLTLIKLQVPELLRKTLNSTNVIESAFSVTRSVARNVKRWQNGVQALRWAAAGLLIAEEKFYRIKGYRQLPYLRTTIKKVLKIEEEENLKCGASA